ncbi:MAG: DNA polymerase II large subunit [Nanoarchaeota archaeon]|nr:DNA polymerase II large subunit [Nanoarchaeota archaeon]
MEASLKMQEYFRKIDEEVNKVYAFANEAKAKGFDPDIKVRVPLAKNMAERVEGLISTVAPEIVGKGVVERIGELEKQYGLQDWRVALKIAEEVAFEKFCKFSDKIKAIETGIRIGFAYVTVGVVSSPLEGFAGIRLTKRNDDGKEYFALFYSGPVRSAGGTGAAVSVLIADYVRKKMGYAQYDPDETEVKRACIEVSDYHERVTNLQYRPSDEEVAFMSSHLPVQIEGDGTAEIEVSNYKGLSRIEANRIRGGFCLVIAECLSAKAKKLWKQLSKWGKDFDLEQWNFLAEFLELQDRVKAKGAVAKKETKEQILPDYTFIKDLVAGRPIIAYPLRNGGLRLRYGRGRASGLSSDAINPATMFILDSFIGIGTQLKTERPGKSTTISVCDCIDGPIVKLNNGSVKRIETIEDAKQYNKDVAEIIYLGDVLVNYGDFLNRGHKLVPCGFNEEWWGLCIEKALVEKGKDAAEAGVKDILEKPITAKVCLKDALEISKSLGVPLHPRWIYYWNTLSKEQFSALYASLLSAAVEPGKVILSAPDETTKRALELIGIPHTSVSKEHVVIEGDDADALVANLGNLQSKPEGESILDMVNSASSVKIKDKLGTFIGARMGRPEKAKMRKLKSSPHVLFPVGDEGGRLRSFQAALEKGKVTAQFPIRYCKKCGKKTVYLMCEECGGESELKYFCPKCNKETDESSCPTHGECLPFKKESIDINSYYNRALKKSKLQHFPEIVKGIRGTSNKEHIPEHILKGILRAKHNICVNKEGTIRYDMTEMSCTHFKPCEVGVSVEKMREMDYTEDCYGKPLENPEQILELKAQDVILPACEDALEEGADNVLFRVANFIDDMLVLLYEQKAYYNLKTKQELVGHLCVAMSPHTAAGIVCRIVGFSKTQGFLAHPLLHCIMRRDCLAYETTLPIFDGVKWNLAKIGEVVEKLNPTRRVDFYGTKAVKVKGFKTLGLNVHTRKLEEVAIRDFTKHAKRNIIKIKLEEGRSIRVTENHAFCIKKGKRLERKEAKDLLVGDELLQPISTKVKETDFSHFNLFEIFSGRKNVVARGIKGNVINAVRKISKPLVRKRASVSKSVLDNYLARDSFPLDFLNKMDESFGMKFSLKNARIAVKRDTVELKPFIELNKDVLWLIGLYVAEGYSRAKEGKKGLFQVDFAATEKEIRDKIIKICKMNFGLLPSYISKEHIVFSSMLLYELFIDFLGCGKKAYGKKVPSLFLSLPLKKLRHFISGYYDGDGSVSLSDARVTCDSVSNELLAGIEFCLSRFGIYTKRHTYRHKPGAKVSSFYIRKGRKIPEFEVTKLIVPSSFFVRFYKEIGFSLARKQNILKQLVNKTKPYGMKIKHDTYYVYPRVVSVEKERAEETYCLNVENHIIFPNNISTYQCDGDEAAVMLLTDHLLNFSKKFLPNTRGATQDAPLLITTKLIPAEVDDMVFDMDTAWKYPIELYEAAEQYKAPYEVKGIEIFRQRLGTEGQYEGMGFTHDTSDFNMGVLCSAYKSIPSMKEKVTKQMILAEKIRAADADDTARLIIERHFIRDIKGNLRKFSTQQFRCVGCNAKYRRPPLQGHCLKCGGKIIFTISHGSVIKYVEPVDDLIRKYNVPAYLRQTVEITKKRIDSVFGRDAERQEGLNKWF